MQWYQIVSVIVSILSVLGFSTIVSTLWKERHEKKKEMSEENQKRRRVERQEELREIIKSEIEPVKSQIEIMTQGTKATLRNDLLKCYYDCKAKGYRTEDDTKNFTEMKNAYHKLGGNSFIDKDISPMFYSIKVYNVELEIERKRLLENKE